MEHKDGPFINKDREAVELTPISKEIPLLQGEQKPT
jgi:hypothetical protein